MVWSIWGLNCYLALTRTKISDKIDTWVYDSKQLIYFQSTECDFGSVTNEMKLYR